MEPNKLKLPLILGVAAILTVFGIIAYFLYAPAPQSSDVPTLDMGPDIAAEVSGAVETPAEKLPTTNPFSDYKNPFE